MLLLPSLISWTLLGHGSMVQPRSRNSIDYLANVNTQWCANVTGTLVLVLLFFLFLPFLLYILFFQSHVSTTQISSSLTVGAHLPPWFAQVMLATMDRHHFGKCMLSHPIRSEIFIFKTVLLPGTHLQYTVIIHPTSSLLCLKLPPKVLARMFHRLRNLRPHFRA